MKNSLYAVLAVTASVLTGGVVSGATQDFTVENNYAFGLVPGYYLNSLGGLVPKTLTGTFNLTTDGFVPGTDVATSGDVFFDITDLVDIRNSEKISIDLGSISEVSGGAVHDYTVDFDSGGGVQALDILADLNTDGELSYTVTAKVGDFFVTDAQLDVTATVPDSDPTPTVPDASSTLGLLGAGVAGLGLVARKFRK